MLANECDVNEKVQLTIQHFAISLIDAKVPLNEPDNVGK